MVDGITGRVIWSFNTTKSEMSSDLIMRTTESQLDFFVFRANGRLFSPHSSTGQRVNCRHSVECHLQIISGHTLSGLIMLVGEVRCSGSIV